MTASLKRTRELLRVGIASLLSVTLGCSSLDVRSPIHLAQPFSSKEATAAAQKPDAPKKKDEKIQYGIPETMAVIWTDSVYTGPGATPTRGFGGRFFFYDMNGQTIRVNGELVVYGFDDTDDRSQRKVPEKKFVYPADQLQAHHSVSDLGPSYNFWIPWDAVGGDRKTISLLPVLKTVDGKVVRGEQTLNVLPGRVPEEVKAQEALMQLHRNMALNATRQVSFTEDPAASRSDHLGIPSRRASTTIDVPRDLGRELRQTPQVPRNVPQRNTSSMMMPNHPGLSMPSVPMTQGPMTGMNAPTASMPYAPPMPQTTPMTSAAAMPMMPNVPTTSAAMPSDTMPMPAERIEGNARVGVGPAPGFRNSRAAAAPSNLSIPNYPPIR